MTHADAGGAGALAEGLTEGLRISREFAPALPDA